MTCGMCRRAQQDFDNITPCDGIEFVDECPRDADKVPKLDQENEGFWFLMLRILPGLSNGFGGFDYNAIINVFNIYEVPQGQRPILHDKCLIVMRAISECREAKKNG